MILIADSGSTKTDWRLIDDQNEVSQAKSPGIQPNYMKPEHIQQVIQEGLSEWVNKNIDEVYFYGSGCSSDANKEIVRSGFLPLFPTAKIEVDHDLLAAARALCGTERGVACILGTGSNSGLYDGDNIVENVKSLGYMLGDEGSGTYLGKELIKHYLRGNLPDKVRDNFKKRFELEDHEIIEKIYKSERPQQFIAPFSKFVFQNIKDPFLYRMAYDAFVAFIDVNVKPYTDYDKVPVHFVGSVAYFFANILRKAGADQGITVKHILEGPIAGLTLYHQKNKS